MEKIVYNNKIKSKVWIAIGFILIVSFSFIFIISGFISARDRTESYLPFLSDSIFVAAKTGQQSFELKSNRFKLEVDDKGGISVSTIKNEVIMSNLIYCFVPEDGVPHIGLDEVKIQYANDTTILIQGKNTMNFVFFSIQISNSSSKIDFNIKTVYGSDIVISREALIAKFEVPVAEVYQKNRKIDKMNLEHEYWLQNEGVSFGGSDRSAMVYHTPSISSLQLDTDKKLLFLNLEFFRDHPHINFPYDKDSTDKWNDVGGKWIDLSKALYKKGTEKNSNFSMYFGNFQKITPRFMLVPKGYLAGYIFTEHADNGNIRTQRAAYFGAEDILKMKDSKGGFVGHKIPVTKSIFYWGDDSITGSTATGNYQDSTLNDFLDQIYSTGIYDLCLHTPENLTSNRLRLEESIRYMKERFNTKTWIDHGFYNGSINREALVADGLDSTSQYYAADLWEKYATQYFWSPAVEKLQENDKVFVRDELKKMNFYKAYVTIWQRYFSPEELRSLNIFQATKELFARNSYKEELNSHMTHLGNAYPTPLYWKHPAITKQFYFWPTNYVKQYKNLSPQSVIIESQQLDKLIKDQGVFIEHQYYVRTSSFNKNVLNNQNGKLVIDPFFNQILSEMAKKRDTGELFITTVKELLDYWIALENVSIEFLPDNSIEIINNNKHPIKGLSFIINANSILVNNAVPLMKHVDDDIIFWFNIDANERKYLHVK